MDADEFISTAIETGSHNGIGALHADQRLVYLVSEAEVYCDMEGIPSFLDNYFPEWMEETAAAFDEIGGAEIAALVAPAMITKASGEQSRDASQRDLLECRMLSFGGERMSAMGHLSPWGIRLLSRRSRRKINSQQ